ncbi:MAG: enolase C-terminal domain-like protein [Burkholderiales bacterium]|jgi:L-alanine-DL-glutamate epimerase-like enolase superfamily enzyme
MSRITRVEVHEFDFEAANLARDGVAQTITFKRGSAIRVAKFAVVIHTADGGRGEYVAQWVATKSSLGQALMLCPRIVGKDARERIAIYEDLKRDIRQFDHMGHGPIDIALWDWAGRHYGASIAELLGGYRKRLPAYASTYHADRAGGLDSKEAFVAFAEHCHGLGYRAFKVHGWNDGNAREEAENVVHLAKHVGSRMTLMLDPACELRTFADALYVGRACDDAGYFWYEDPYRDGGTSAFAHKRLREMIKTPLLMTEHVRGVEPKADFVLAGGTDFVRVDPEYDMGITGSLKIAHMAESLGLDCEIHASGPAHRHLMAAMRNSNYYEVALVGPDCPNAVAPVYACGYSDQLDCVAADGTVGVPEGPGLGVTYDWDFISKHRTALHVFE